MLAPGRVISGNGRRRTEEFVRRLNAVIADSGIAESVIAKLRGQFALGGGNNLDKGIPIIADVELHLPDEALVRYSRNLSALLCDVISEKFHNLKSLVSDDGKAATAISSLTTVTLCGSGIAVAEFGRFHNIELEHLAFFANYLARPIRGAVASITLEHDLASGWKYGYCPACGLWARMGHIDSHEGGRKLWCLGCGFSWQFPRLCCPFCIERRPGQMGFLRVDESDRFRVYTCESCRRYLKTVVAPQDEAIAYDIEYLSSSAYDVTASFEKYVQDFVGFAAFDMKDNAASQAYRQRALS